MDFDPWPLMAIGPGDLGRGTGVEVRIGGDADDLARRMAEEMADLIREANRRAAPACAIIPVGPVGQYEILARRVAEEGLDLSGLTLILMDEFLDVGDVLVDAAHPLSFRGFLRRVFFDRLPPAAGFRPENFLVPDPRDPEAVWRAIARRKGVDVCFGGIGLNGHLAFNEPEDVPAEVFANRPTRLVEIAPESRAHVAVNLSCALGLIPRRAVTVGMREILGSARISLWANRPWQRGVVRVALHGPISPACPASFLQGHPSARLTVADFVAERPEVRLR